jgi:hypothetical protein
VYEVPRSKGIVSGAPGARIASLDASSMTLDLPRRGSYRIAVRYSPYWHASTGCIRRRADGMISLRVPEPGSVKLHFGVTASRAVDASIGETPDCPAKVSSGGNRRR